MLWPVFISGFMLGAMGSLHCIGMCGPLSLALPIHHLSKLKKFFSLLLYQLGRIITYSAIGLLFGLVGRRMYIAGFQQYFSIIMGIIVIGLSLMYFFREKTIHLKFFNRFYFFIQRKMAKLLHSNIKPSGFLLLGMANGFLPCGMVYIALAATLSFTEIIQSVSFMAMFGAGTLPAMMMVGLAGQLLKPGLRLSIQKIVPVFMTAMGIILVLRGMNLGIPFISPQLPQWTGNNIICHP